MDDTLAVSHGFTGKTLAEAAPELCAETLACLRLGDFSPAGRIPRAALVEAVIASLGRARIASRCDCGMPGCESYRFATEAKPDAGGGIVLRLFVRGDLMVHVDEDGDVSQVERLYLPDDDGAPLRVYAQHDDGTVSFRVV